MSWAHARTNWSIRLHLRPFLRKDERENNANVLDSSIAAFVTVHAGCYGGLQEKSCNISKF